MTPIKVDALFPFSDKLPTPTPLHSAGLAWPGWNGGMHTNNNNTSSVHPSLRRMEVGAGGMQIIQRSGESEEALFQTNNHQIDGRYPTQES